jgi:hypothetical protein
LVGGAAIFESCVCEVPLVQPLPNTGALAQPNPLVTAENSDTPDMYAVESR